MSNPVGNPNITEAGKKTQFSKERQPMNNGRKPSKLKKWIKELDLSKTDVNAVFKNFLYGKSNAEIEDLINDKEKRDKLPFGLSLHLTVLINQAKKGDGKHLETIHYMLYGKPKESVEVSGLQLKVITEEQAEALET